MASNQIAVIGSSLIFIALLSVLPTPEAAARLPYIRKQAARAHGVVRIIDLKEKKLTIQLDDDDPDDDPEMFVCRWTENTQFIRDGRQVGISSLKIGLKVKARYYAPLIGGTFTTQIIWNTTK